MYNDQMINYPVSVDKYLINGGNVIDYYLGYNLFTCLDTADFTRGWEKFDRFFSAGIPIILITTLWLSGFYFRNKRKIFMVITTIISLYYIYYSYVYLTKFFLLSN
jgi:hypothetical protein